MRLIIFLFLLIAAHAVGQLTPVKIASGNFAPVGIASYAGIFEEQQNQHRSIQTIKDSNQLFTPLKNYHQKKSSNICWIKVLLHNSSAKAMPVVVSFINISYVDIWLTQGDSILLTKKAGIFRYNQEIADGDERTFMNLDIPPHAVSCLYIRVNETKGFMPGLNFKISGRESFYKKLNLRKGIDFALMGAVAILFIYIFIAWLLSRYSPYIWLMVFSFGIFTYTFCLNGYFVQWILPGYPVLAWALSSHFAHLGLAGSCLLIDGFLGLGAMQPRFYKVFQTFPFVLVATSVAMLLVLYFLHQYPVTLYTSTFVTALIYPLAFYFIVTTWGRLPAEKRLFAFGVLMAIALGVSQNLLFFLLAENAISPAALIASAGLVVIMLMFLVSIKEGMRRKQKYKYNTLAEISQLREQQNLLLEEKVKERTLELDLRNKKIQSLMHELQHRVKNNLQLLYGLNRMKMPEVEDGKAKEVWKKNLVQIKAISLANNQIERGDESGNVWINDYIQQIVSHTRQIYDIEEKVLVTLLLQGGMHIKITNAISFGLILTELLINSYQYAFNEPRDEPEIVLRLFVKDGKNQFVYYDNGTGFSKASFEGKDNGGFALVKDLARQLGGTLNLQYKVKEMSEIERNGALTKQDEPNTIFSFTFPASL